MDKKASAYEYMFLPDYIESGFKHATLNGNALVKQNVSVYESRDEEPKKHFFILLLCFLFLQHLL